MSFRLVTNSVTLDDLEQRNTPSLCYFTQFGSFRGALRKMRRFDGGLRSPRAPVNQSIGLRLPRL